LRVRRTTRRAARRSRKSCSRLCLPRGTPYEERSQAVEVLRGLLGLAHLLHDGRQRVQVRAQEADDEVVVVLVEAVAGEAHVVGVAACAVTLRERAVLGEDAALVIG